MRAVYERAAGLDAALSRVGELSARTVIFDVEPLVASWNSGQDALERGLTRVVQRACQLPEVQLMCFATNSMRRPRVVPVSAGVRVVYLASADKPMRIAPYRGFPRPGVVVGDQIATDGLLARRLRYAFVHYRPPLDENPAGPRLLRELGRPGPASCVQSARPVATVTVHTALVVDGDEQDVGIVLGGRCSRLAAFRSSQGALAWSVEPIASEQPSTMAPRSHRIVLLAALASPIIGQGSPWWLIARSHERSRVTGLVQRRARRQVEARMPFIAASQTLR